jgi:2-methylcitrate dehydratase
MKRRELIKLGAGAVAAALTTGQQALAQRGASRGSAPPAAPGSGRPAGELRPHTGPGYKNDYHRLGENGPMDDTTRKIVKYVGEFKESDMTPPVIEAFNRTMVDSMAATIAGFEEVSARIATRLARLSPPGDLKSTVFGYGVVTTPELATFANGCMVRNTDFNDMPHHSNLIPAALAIGEAVHSTGAQVMAAIIVGYELMGVPAGGESVAPAMAAGKLMGLDEDRLANALTIALTPHVALNKGVGALSMWKGVRSAEATKCGVWAALLAREGMTGPPQPFEGRGGLWSRNGPGRPFTLPDQPRLQIERMVYKRWPSDMMTQGMLALIPEIRAWTKPEEIEAIQYDMTFGDWQECGSNPKWDPRNRDTADHSIPYVLARALIEGPGYTGLGAFTPEKLADPVARALMAKMTLGPVAEWRGNGTARVTIRKSNGEQKSFDTYGGNRDPRIPDDYPRMTDADITNKFNRVCAFRQVTDAQRDRARQVWGNLRAVKDIGDAIRTLATFGKPLPL